MLDRILDNWPLKLLAIVLAFAIWVSVTGEKRTLQDFEIPLEIRVADEHVLASMPPNTVTVRLRGSESLLRRLDPLPFVVRADLSEASVGEQDVQLTARDISGLPRGAEVDFIDPDRIRVVIDRRLTRELPVEPTFLGQPPEGFAFYGAQVAPETLPVEGPASQVSRLEVLRTNPIRLDDRTAPFRARVGVVPEGSLVRLLDPRPLEVGVVVDAAAVERRIERLPVRVAGGPPGAAARPETIDVTVSGPPQLLERLRRDQLRVVADAGRAAEAPDSAVDVRVRFVDISPEDQERLSVKSVSRRRVRVEAAGAQGSAP